MEEAEKLGKILKLTNFSIFFSLFLMMCNENLQWDSPITLTSLEIILPSVLIFILPNFIMRDNQIINSTVRILSLITINILFLSQSSLETQDFTLPVLFFIKIHIEIGISKIRREERINRDVQEIINKIKIDEKLMYNRLQFNNCYPFIKRRYKEPRDYRTIF